MKKLFLFLITAVVLTACTSKEQDEKIHAFWAEQAQKAMIKFGPAFAQGMSKAGPLMAAQMSKMQKSGEMSDADFEKMMKQMQNDPEFIKFMQEQESQKAPQSNTPAPAKPQFMDITMDDENLSAAQDPEDRQMINDSIRDVQQSNQEFISSLSAKQYTQEERTAIMAIFTEEEKQLKALAATSPDFISFMKAEMEIVNQTHQKLQKLIEQKYQPRKSSRAK